MKKFFYLNKICFITNLIYDQQPSQIEIIKPEDNNGQKSTKYILNAAYRENGQRNYIQEGLVDAKNNDLILISDVDEIPSLFKIDFDKLNEKIILFKQDMFYYKFNLFIPNFRWTGTKGCRKKNLISPQWLRNIKDRKYSAFRLDILFSKKKYSSVKILENGGWHFSNIKTAKEIEHKLKSYLHHREFDIQPLTVDEIQEIIENKQAIYDLKVDKTVKKIGNGSKLQKMELNKLPIYIQENQNKFEDWID